MKIGDLVKSADRYARGDHKLGILMEIDTDGWVSCDTIAYFIRWMGDADWSLLYEEDFEVISESR